MTFPRIAIVGFAHSPNVAVTHGTTNGVEMLRPCFDKLYAQLGITRTDIEFWCSGSSDYLAGRAFSFISAVDSIGAMPPSVPMPTWSSPQTSMACSIWRITSIAIGWVSVRR